MDFEPKAMDFEPKAMDFEPKAMIYLPQPRANFEFLSSSHSATRVAISVNIPVIQLLIFIKVSEALWYIFGLMKEYCAFCATMICSGDAL
jgi:hypothetical protein